MAVVALLVASAACFIDFDWEAAADPTLFRFLAVELDALLSPARLEETFAVAPTIFFDDLLKLATWLLIWESWRAAPLFSLRLMLASIPEI